MNTEKEQIIKLRDGRTIYKTHNGFKYFAETKKGEVAEVEESYYDQAKKLMNKKTNK